MEATRLASFQADLEQRLAQLQKEGDLSLANTSREGGSESVVAKVDEDAAPLSEMNQVIASSRNQERFRQMKLIERALKRIQLEPEDFGMCERCEEEIPERRLSLMPWATHCIRCQSKEEDESVGGRKHLTDYR